MGLGHTTSLFSSCDELFEPGVRSGRRKWMRGLGQSWEAAGTTHITASATWPGASLAN